MDIDVVYTWVNHEDREWQKQFQQAVALDQKKKFSPLCSRDSARFANRNELYYSLVSLNKYAPWVRKIYIVTNCSLPSWAVKNPKITGINHEEIFVDSKFLPTFNSHAIEANLHRIDGLSEHFLYFNDDMFLARPVNKNLFFSNDGKNNVFKSKHHILYDRKDNLRSIDYSILNTAKLLDRDFGIKPDFKLHHAPYPMKKSTLIELEDMYGKEILNTSKNKFRDKSDIPLATTLHAYYSLLKGYGKEKPIESRYMDISNPLFLLLIFPYSKVWRKEYDTFCLNEVNAITYFRRTRDKLISLFLKKYFT